MFGTSTSHELSLIEPAAEHGEALKIFDHVPVGFIAFAVDDRSVEPLVRKGEIIIADLSDREIEPGGLYLRRNVSGDGQARVCIDEVFTQKLTQRADDGSFYKADAFFFGDHNRPKSVEDYPAWIERNGSFFPMSDGPFFPKRCDYWRHQAGTIVGRVVGILAIASSHQQPAG